MNESYQLVNVENMAESFKQFGRMCAECLNSIAKVFIDIFENLKESCPSLFKMTSKKISRKRFIKLLMSDGIQRNKANLIAKYYHTKNGGYKYTDVLTEWRKNNDK